MADYTDNSTNSNDVSQQGRLYDNRKEADNTPQDQRADNVENSDDLLEDNV